MYSKFPLGKYVKVIGGYAFKSEDFSESGNPVIRISDIANGTVQINKSAKIENRKVGKGANYKIDKGDILIAMSGATTGKIGVVPDYIDCDIYQNQRVGNFKILDATKLNKRFLRYVILSPFYQREIHQTMAGAAQPNISSGQLESIEIPLPPLPEQNRIAEVLDKADALREKRRLALQKLDTLLQSVFLEMFGDPVKNPKGWEMMTVGDAVELINGRAFKPTEWSNKGLPIIRIQNLKNKKASFNYYEGVCEEKFRVKKGDLLMSWAGQLVSFGVTTWQGENGWLNQHIFRIVPKIPLEIPFLEFALSQVVEKAKGNFKGIEMKHITKTDLNKYELFCPSTELQKRFSEVNKKIQKLKIETTKSYISTENLFQSLQQKAFKGELFSNEFPAIESQDEKVWQQTSLF